MQEAFTLVRQAGRRWKKHNASRLAAALAYYTTLSLAPLLIVSVAFVGILYRADAGRDYVLTQVGSVLGDQGVSLMRPMLEKSSGAGTSLALVIGLATALLAAIGVFQQLRDAVNVIWEVTPPSRGILGVIEVNAALFLLLLASGLILFASVIIGAVLSGFGTEISSYLGLPSFTVAVLNIVLAILISTGLFTLLFRYLPARSVPWKASLSAAALTAILFELSRHLIGFYLGKASPGSSYGAAGSLVALMLWVYYTDQIILFGVAMSREITDPTPIDANEPKKAPSFIGKVLAATAVGWLALRKRSRNNG